MRALRAIIALTFRNALRSHIFRLLLVVLLLCVLVIPVSIGGGDARNFIRVSLLYSVGSVTLILSLASLWLGCFTMSQDVDSYQLHMVVAKPVSRVTVWFGKWLGVLLINLILLFIALTAVYGIIIWRYRADDRFTQEERQKIASEVLVGRRVFMPKRPDTSKLVEEMLQKKLAELKKAGDEPGGEKLKELRQEIERKVDVSLASLRAGQSRTWVYENVPDPGDRSLVLRFRPYIGKISSEEQRMTRLWWQVLIPVRGENGKVRQGYYYPQILTAAPEQLPAGGFYEKVIPAEWKVVSPDGVVAVSVMNQDRYKADQYYQSADGPKLLVKVCNFELNYLRMILVSAIQLALLSALACAFGGFLTMPTAVFMVVCYLLIGTFSQILTGSEFFVSSIWDKFGQGLASLLLLIVIPIQSFDVTSLLADGELIEFSLIGRLIFNFFLLRGVPFFLFGIWLYCRRELGLVTRK